MTKKHRQEALAQEAREKVRKPLTDEEAQQIFAKHNCTISTHLAGILARAIERAHGIGVEDAN